MDGRTLDFIALGILIFVVLTIIYGVIYIHDIPYEIAKKRNHPHQDAIHTAGWVSLFLMHTIWPFLWIWATLYKPEIGWGFGTRRQTSQAYDLADHVHDIEERFSRMDHKRNNLQNAMSNDLGELSSRVFELENRFNKIAGE